MKESFVKNVLSLLIAMTLGGALGWVARGPYLVAYSAPVKVPTTTATPAAAAPRTARAAVPASAVPSVVPPLVETTEAPVPVEVLAPVATITATMPALEDIEEVVTLKRDPAAPRPIIVPVTGVARSAMRDMFNEGRGDHRHEAIDILAPRGTPVVAADDGVVKKIFTSVAGGLTVYEFDPDERFCYYYAHLDRYVAGLHEGQKLRRGEILGYVGTSGNAPKNTPHLHFALIRLDPDNRWWKGTYVNPYPLLVGPKTP